MDGEGLQRTMEGVRVNRRGQVPKAKWRKASRKWDRIAELNALTDGAGTCLLNLATGDLV